ncbi:LysM peptidoglycan-binding domain-containing protein [Glaciecola sp. 1036]|uniref:LysM peptidoglycan-binding domain-containing protein n=1 Tax=Alteromonadaceae TaxID=72275 RepID=UPI003D08C1CF
MGNHKLKIKSILVVLCMLGLSACGMTQKTSTKDAVANNKPIEHAPVTKVPLPIAEANLTPKQRMSKAVRSLENGESEVAEVELIEYQKSQPNSHRAANLLRQIRTPSRDYYPSDYFTLELKSGQSLSTLAKKYLGTPWDFYALAKYNQISNPSKIHIGAEVKIPLTQLAKQVRNQEIKPTPVAKKETLKVDSAPTKKEVEAEDVAPAPVQSEVDEYVQLSGLELLQQAISLNTSGDYVEASFVFDELNERTGLPSEMQKQIRQALIVNLQARSESLIETAPQNAAELLTQMGDLYLTDSDEIKAFEAFKSAKEVDPTNSNAAKSFEQLREQISEHYHREASIAFRQQALDEAIEKWDLVLYVNPQHSNALAYRTQAVELKKRLEAIK